MELSSDALEILDEISETCREENIELIFFTLSWQRENNYHDAVEKCAEKNGCRYLDLYYHMNEMGIDVNKDYIDISHLNPSGAAKVSDYLEKYLSPLQSSTTPTGAV